MKKALILLSAIALASGSALGAKKNPADFKKADTNADGQISPAEYTAARIAPSKKYWINKKKLSQAEFAAKLVEMKATIYPAAFKHLDKNKDGLLSQKEFDINFRMSNLKKK